jgi:hypothetical protein
VTGEVLGCEEAMNAAASREKVMGTSWVTVGWKDGEWVMRMEVPVVSE